MRRALLLRLVGILAAGLATPGPAASETSFRVMPSVLGEGTAPGETRRIIQTFGGWTLVCDENLRRRQKVCNVSQSFLDGSGRTAFSWSLAATREGAPVMILRMPREGRDARFVSLTFAGEADPIGVTLATCAEELCLGYLPVTARLGAKLRAGGRAGIELLHEGRFQTIEAPLAGLSGALEALR